MALNPAEQKQLDALEAQVRNRKVLDYEPKKQLKALRAKAQESRKAGVAFQRTQVKPSEVMPTKEIDGALDELRGKDLRNYLMDVDLSEWAGENLGMQEAEAVEQLRQRDLTVQGEQILRDLKNESAFEKSGVPRSKMPGRGQRMQNVLGTLKSDNPEGVVGAFVRSGTTKDGTPFENRHYTREVESPLIKGYKEVVPFENPETGKPLKTTFGDANKLDDVNGIKIDSRWDSVFPEGHKYWIRPQAGDRATEVVGRHTAHLAGLKGVKPVNDLTVEDFTGIRDWQEFKRKKDQLTGVDLTSASGPLDIETRGSSKAGKPTAANIQIESWTDGDFQGKQRAIQSQVRQGGIKGAAKRAGYRSQDGKLGKKYDVIQNEYSDAVQQKNLGLVKDPVTGRLTETIPQSQTDKITSPPKKVRFLDNKVLNDHIDSLGTNVDSSRVVVKGKKVVWEAPEGTPGITDISKRGHVPQILENLDYTVKPEVPVRGPAPKPKPMVAAFKETPKIAGVITPDQAIAGARKIAKPFKGQLKVGAGAALADVAVGGVLSYATGESDNAQEAAWAGATSLIPDSGAAGGKTLDIDGKLYNHDESTNMIYGMDGKVSGLAYKGGKPVAVPYGSLEGRTSMMDDVVTPIKSLATQIKETHQKRQAEKAQMNPTVGPPALRPKTGKEWWKKGVESVMNYFQ